MEGWAQAMAIALESVGMKAVYVDFVKPQAWKIVWGIAAILLLVIGVVYGAQGWELQQQRRELESRLAALALSQNQQIALANNESAVPDNPKAGSEAAARQLLQWDWNRVYDAIESPALAKTKLVQMSVDVPTGQATLVFELDSMAQVGQVTKALNEPAGSGAVWRLERLENKAQTTGLGATSTNVKGVWLGKLN